MSKTPVESWLDQNKEQFDRYNEYCFENNWVMNNSIEEYQLQKNIINIVIDRLKYFTEKFDIYLHFAFVKKFIKSLTDVVDLHINRCEIYIKENDWTKKTNPEERAREVETQNKIMSDLHKMKDTYTALSIFEAVETDLPIHSDKPIPMLMKDSVKARFPIVSSIETQMKQMSVAHTSIYDINANSSEFFINYKNPPPYDPTKHYFEQPQSTIDFYEEEKRKFNEGLTINGTFIHPWLYFHLNFFKTDIPMSELKGTPFYNPNKKVEIVNPPLRDNEWFFANMYHKASLNNVGVFMYGSRRIGKALADKEILHYVDGTKRPIGLAKEGDIILDGNRKSTVIKGVYPQGKISLFELTLETGEYIECCQEHLWLTRIDGREQVINTEEIIKRLLDGSKVELPINKTKREFKQLKTVEYVGKNYATCIEVDNEEKLFLTTNDFVTHNTTIESSVLTWGVTKTANSENSVIGGDEGDLQKLSKGIEIGFGNMHPAFRLPRNNNDWSTHVQFGLKDKAGERIPYGDIFIRNVNGGRGTSTEKTAGASPDFFIIDEAGKFNVKPIYQAAIPSFQTPSGWRVTPIMSGCLTAGNRVWNDKGDLINIEDVQLDDSIIGISDDNTEIAKNKVSWLQPPAKKECIKIITRKGSVVECSTDHPFLVKKQDELVYIEAKDIEVNTQLVLPDIVPLFGDVHVLNAYEIGLVGKVPEDIHRVNRETLQEYIAGIAESGYSVCNYTEKTIAFKNSKRRSVEDLKLALMKFGVHSSIYHYGNTIYTLTINDNLSLKRFLTDIPLRKESRDYRRDALEERIEKWTPKLESEFQGVRFESVKRIVETGEKEIYNLTADTTHTYIANGIVTHNTSGNQDLSTSAQNMLLYPEENKLLVMDWDFLEEGMSDKSLATWERRPFGIFVPAQMSYKTGIIKDKTNLGDYLKKPSKELKNIKINATNWEQANEVINQSRDELTKDLESLNKEKVYYPIDPLECFLSSSSDSFCIKETLEHKEALLASGDYGKHVDIEWDDIDKKLLHQFSSKEPAPHPYAGGNVDAPVIIFEDPPIKPAVDFEYVAGLDHYKNDKSKTTNSLGSIYVFKRNINIGDYNGRIVASYTARPDTMEQFNETAEKLIKGYGAITLQEGTDISFQQHLRQKFLENIYLANGENVAKLNIRQGASQANKLSLSATAVNQQYLFKLLQEYINEYITIGTNEDGSPIRVRGVTRINDIHLLDEIINYYPGGNFDRLDSFSHALALARYYDSLNIIPKVRAENKQKVSFEEREKKRELRQKSYGVYGGRRYSPY